MKHCAIVAIAGLDGRTRLVVRSGRRGSGRVLVDVRFESAVSPALARSVAHALLAGLGYVCWISE